jgi:CHAT domain-containing protein
MALKTMSKRPHPSPNHQWLAILCIITLSLCLWVGHLPLTLKPVEWEQAAIAQTPDASQQVEQGVERYQAGDYPGAIALWENALNTYQNTNNAANAAIVSGNLAQAYQQVGQIDKAIQTWEKLIAYYRQAGNLQKVGRLLTEQAQAYIQQGKNRQAIALLCGSLTTDCLPGTALAIAREQKDQLTQVAALGTLGEAYRLRGKYDEAIHYLKDAQKREHSAYQFSLLNSLGNTYLAVAQRWDGSAKSAKKNESIIAKSFQEKARDNYQRSLDYFQESLSLAVQEKERVKQMQSLLNLIQLSSHSNRFNLTNQVALNRLVRATLTLLEQLPDSPLKVKASIELANLPDRTAEVTAPLAQCYSPRQLSDSQAEELLNRAIKIAGNINDSRSQSFALGSLGHFYECQKDDKKALELTQEALLNADQNLINKDSLYLWEWQAGRIFRAQAQQLIAQGKDSEAQKKQLEAISAFERAFRILEQIRSDILIAERDVQFDFRDTIEPVYRQLAQLRLRLAALLNTDNQQKEELNQALKTIESLRLAELQNYLGNDCFLPPVNFEEIEQVIKNDTAILNSVILEDRTAIIMSLPQRNPQVNWIEENRQTVEAKIKRFREELVYGMSAVDRGGIDVISKLDYDSKTADTKTAKELYDWFIKPLESYLNPDQIKTLVFVQDGLFRTIPMAALYDGQRFLVEKYAIAITPSRQLINVQKFNPKESRALILGLTKAAQVDGQEFEALTNVLSEIQEVQRQFPEHKILLDEQFNQDNLEKELDRANYQIVHVGTHAQFGFIPEETFLVTGDNNKITIEELETALRRLSGGAQSIELLALTACETAAGDERAALGLAGVAIQTSNSHFKK